MADDILQALNDIQTALGNLDPPGGTSGETLDQIALNIDAIRVAIETGDSAGIVAQNTNFNDLVGALNALNFCCPPLVYKATPFFFDDEPQPTEGTEFQTPPTGWQATSVQPGSADYYDRKCAAANQNVDGLIYIFTELDSVAFDELAQISTGAFMATVTGILVALVAAPYAVAVGVVGGIASLVVAFLAGGWNPSSIANIATNNRTDLVCAMYEANDASTAKTDVLDIFETNGANAVERSILSILFDQSGAMNNLFFERPDVVPPPSPYTTDCTGCQTCPDPWKVLGTVTAGTVAPGNTVTIDSVQIGSFWYISLGYNFECGGCQTFDAYVRAQTTGGSHAGSAYTKCPYGEQWFEHNQDFTQDVLITTSHISVISTAPSSITIEIVDWT